MDDAQQVAARLRMIGAQYFFPIVRGKELVIPREKAQSNIDGLTEAAALIDTQAAEIARWKALAEDLRERLRNKLLIASDEGRDYILTSGIAAILVSSIEVEGGRLPPRTAKIRSASHE